MPDDSSNDDLYSIGRAAAIVGITPATMRIWERRYGRPIPVRLPSGHRRFTGEQVRWLRRVAEALARGARASEAVGADAATLDRLLSADARGAPVPERILELVKLAREFDSPGLADALRADRNSLGPLRFVLERAAPLVTEIGRAWADGRIHVRHEHLATQHVEDVLRALRGELPGCDDGPVFVLTTLAGESHALGLQMVAILAAVERCTARVLGPETPLDEIVATAAETGAAAVGIGVSLATGGTETDRMLADLRSRLPSEVRLLVGGEGARRARRGPRSVDYVADLHECLDWLRTLRAAHDEPSA